MPDIAMCKGECCPLRDSCHRYKAKPDTYQTYFVTAPYDKKAAACGAYWETEKQYVYYLPELNLLATAESNQREVFVVYIKAIGDFVPFDSYFIGEL
ncbi:MAG: hypothetical protein ACAH17_03465 [Candidatus Paceibacterota bacterium]